MQTDCLYVFDFDGVLCDSIRECFVSSWYAYFHYHKGTDPGSVELDRKERFYRYRPYIRTGEDYVLLHDLIERGREIRSQEEFDEEKRAAGPEFASRFRSLIYRTREEFLSNDREWWLSLNPLYPGLHGSLVRIAERPDTVILSTKRPDLIAEILGAAGIDWPGSRIHHSGETGKLPFVSKLRAEVGAREAVFVDDQRDHLMHGSDPAVRCFLAVWGYVQPQWLSEPGPELLSLRDFTAMLDRLVPV
jgi:phosphoglycolate phosphatase-like HAD superfamily hydrolase